jgi:hypothetical protein
MRNTRVMHEASCGTKSVCLNLLVSVLPTLAFYNYQGSSSVATSHGFAFRNYGVLEFVLFNLNGFLNLDVINCDLLLDSEEGERGKKKHDGVCRVIPHENLYIQDTANFLSIYYGTSSNPNYPRRATHRHPHESKTIVDA